MGIDLRVTIEKMITCCDNAQKYAHNISYEEFVSNELYLTFAVFSLSQLGELATVLSKRTDCAVRYPHLPWIAMRSLRNNIVHDYDGLRLNVIWSTIREDIPVLKKQLESILEQLS